MMRLLLALAACASAGDAVEVFQVVIPCTVGCPEPQTANPDLKHPDAPSRLYAESETARLSKLVVFLPGSSASAQSYRWLLASLGQGEWGALGLMYSNHLQGTSDCDAGAPPCYEDLLTEITYGGDHSPFIEVPESLSVVSRLKAVLQAAPAQFSGFLGSDGEPVWADIAIAGHSQGSSVAMFISYRE